MNDAVGQEGRMQDVVAGNSYVSKAVSSEARRVFLLSGSILIECYECRGTMPDAHQLLSPVTDFSTGKCGSPGLSSD